MNIPILGKKKVGKENLIKIVCKCKRSFWVLEELLQLAKRKPKCSACLIDELGDDPMTHSCPLCKVVIAKEDEDGVTLLPKKGSQIIVKGREAPKIKCGKCGHTTILIKVTI